MPYALIDTLLTSASPIREDRNTAERRLFRGFQRLPQIPNPTGCDRTEDKKQTGFGLVLPCKGQQLIFKAEPRFRV